MKIYESLNLKISFEKENDRFIQLWINSPDSIDSFKKEMVEYTKFYKQYKPTQTLWLQQNFNLNLDNDTFKWIEEQVNIPCLKFGNEKAAFVVGKDVLSHLTVIDSFEKEKSVINVKHFASEKQALNWLDEIAEPLKEDIKTEITYHGIDQEGNSIIKIKRTSKDITKTIKSFKELIEENDFIKKNIKKYLTLTNREKEVLKLYSLGHKNQEISENLFISIHTVQTHRKNIKRKLQTNSFNEIIKYIKAFDL